MRLLLITSVLLCMGCTSSTPGVSIISECLMVDAESSVAMGYTAILKPESKPDPSPKPKPPPDEPDGELPQLTLPSDGMTWYTVFILSNDRYQNEQQKKFVDLVDARGPLNSFFHKTRRYTFRPGHRAFERYATRFDYKLPQLWIFRGDGKSAYAKAGDDIPLDRDELIRAIAGSFEKMKPAGLEIYIPGDDAPRYKTSRSVSTQAIKTPIRIVPQFYAPSFSSYGAACST